MRRLLSALLLWWLAGADTAHAADDPPTPPPETSAAPADDHGDGSRGEVIEVSGSGPRGPGTVQLDADTARKAPGALGEPLRALALLPGVTTSIAAAGYPIIRGTLPGESRFTFDGIELPMLYHFLLGSQLIHPAFLGDLELRAGGHGAEQGNLIGGLIALTPATLDGTRTELRANPIEIGVFRSQALSTSTVAAVAARVGTLGAAAKIYRSSVDLHYVDQQTRIVHRLGNGDALTLTSLAAFDYLGFPSDGIKRRTVKLGFHRLDGRWTRARDGWGLRAGIETQVDDARSVTVYEPPPTEPGLPPPPDFPPHREGGRSYGLKAYVNGSVRLTRWLGLRSGIEARHRALINGPEPFQLTESADPFLGLAQRVDAQGAWTAVDVRAGRLTITPGIRADVFHADLYGSSVRHVTLDPRLAITTDVSKGVRAELAAGAYSAPPQVSLFEGSAVIGPLPMTDGAASTAGMNHGFQAQASIRARLGAGLEGSFAAYYRDTHYAVDFGIGDHTFQADAGCELDPRLPEPAHVYRDIDTRSIGAEVMLRRDLARSVTGWISYSLGKVDRDFGFIRLPGDYDQRHTLNATAQWKLGRWLLGATGHLHTGRPLLYPQLLTCMTGPVTIDSSYISLERWRRAPMNWRVDLRAERAFQFTGWRMNLFLEVQNASLTKEVIGYEAAGSQIEPQTLFIPLPLVGLEAVL